MKKYVSLLMLYAGATVPRLLLLLGLTAAAETGLFYAAMSPERNLAEVFTASHISLVLAAAFLLLTLLLTLPRFDAAQYTFARLSLNPRAIFLCHALYAACCYLLLWGFQVCLLMGLFHWYGTQASEGLFGPQSIALAFYQIPLLHGLLPLAHWSVYLRNFAFALGLGFVTAFPNTRPGKQVVLFLPAALAIALLFVFPASLREQISSFLLAGSALCIAVTALQKVERVEF